MQRGQFVAAIFGVLLGVFLLTPAPASADWSASFGDKGYEPLPGVTHYDSNRVGLALSAKRYIEHV